MKDAAGDWGPGVSRLVSNSKHWQFQYPATQASLWNGHGVNRVHCGVFYKIEIRSTCCATGNKHFSKKMVFFSSSSSHLTCSILAWYQKVLQSMIRLILGIQYCSWGIIWLTLLFDSVQKHDLSHICIWQLSWRITVRYKYKMNLTVILKDEPYHNEAKILLRCL